MESKTVRVRIGDSDLVFETGKIAKQANGAVYASYEGSAVLATVCSGPVPNEELDYVPLSVEYNEKYYAAGKIPGGFLKREGRPRDKEILVSRLIDRPMRPLFDKAFGREIQIIPTVVSSDMNSTPDIIAINAASCAVVISDIPFNGPIAAVRVARSPGSWSSTRRSVKSRNPPLISSSPAPVTASRWLKALQGSRRGSDARSDRSRRTGYPVDRRCPA